MLIASRELRYETEDGTVISVPIRIYAPEGAGKDWRSRFTIGWPNGVYAGAGHGVDQVQALILALQSIGVKIYFSDYHKTGRLYFDKPGNGYDFPVPKNARDLLVGDDKKFGG
jgi:hypothetical protein